MPDLHIYLPKQLDTRLTALAAELEAQGIDVKPENRTAKTSYSVAKILDYLLTKEGK